MFTGIVDHGGILRDIKPIATGVRAVIQAHFSDFVLGESIAVDGVCLTVVDFEVGLFSCDLSPETLNKTIAKLWQKGWRVNLERALRVGDRLGGHWVMGHVDDTAEIKKVVSHVDYTEVHFQIQQPEQQRYLVSKGSVAINGVSLTINAVFEGGFSVMLIPHTQERTNLSDLKIGQRVNIEFDYLVKAVVGAVAPEMALSIVRGLSESKQ